MIDLNKLTVPFLDKLAKEINITFKSSSQKADKIKTILNAGIPNTKLEELYNKYLSQYEATKITYQPYKFRIFVTFIKRDYSIL